MENWKKFDENDNKEYFVSTAGRLKSTDVKTNEDFIMKPTQRNDGYRIVHINGKTCYVHRLVAEAFIDNPDNKPTVNHKNGVDAGDSVDNLDWATYAEQTQHAYEMGLITSGATPMIALDSNGEVIAQHDTTIEALSCYNGKQLYYSKDIQVIGNVILMKQSHYDTLSDSELFAICYDCLQLMLQHTYVIDNQLTDGLTRPAEVTETTIQNVNQRIKNKWQINVKGHNVSRVSNMLNGSIDKTYVNDIEMQEHQKFIDYDGQLENDSK